MPIKKSLILEPSFRKAKAAFDLSYYRWAQRQGQEEVNRDFVTLRLIRDELVYRMLDILESIGKEEQFAILSALIKRAHKDGAEEAGEAITRRDQELIDRYLHRDRHETATGDTVVDATFERRGNKKLYRPAKERAVLPKINKETLRRLVVKKLQPVLGVPCASDTSDSWRYETKVGPWSVLTFVDGNKRFVHLSYFQRINVYDDLNLQFALSARQWFGIGGGSTDWKLWDDSEIEEATDGLALLVGRFVRAAPMILREVPPVEIES